MGVAAKVKRRAGGLTSAVVRMAIPVAILVLLGFGCHVFWSPDQAGTEASFARDDVTGSTASQVVAGDAVQASGGAMVTGWLANPANGPLGAPASAHTDPIATENPPGSGTSGELNGFDRLWGSLPLWIQAFVIVLCPLLVLFMIVLLRHSGVRGKPCPRNRSGGDGHG